MNKIPALAKVVEAYISCGKAIGFFHAEMILMKHLPENKPDGKCYDVPKSQRASFLRELKKAVQDASHPTSKGEPA